MTQDFGPEGPPQFELLALIKAIGPRLATGEVALGLAYLIHEMRLDSPGQWGNLYYRCPGCGQARDAHDGDTRDIYCQEDDCEHGLLDIEDLQISEGWIERLQ